MNETISLCIHKNKHGRSIVKSSHDWIFGRSPYGYRHLEYDRANGRWKLWKPKSLIRIGVTNLAW